MRKIFILHSCTNHYARTKPEKNGDSFLAFNTNYRILRASTNAYYIERAKQKREDGEGGGEEESRRAEMGGELCAAES